MRPEDSLPEHPTGGDYRRVAAVARRHAAEWRDPDEMGLKVDPLYVAMLHERKATRFEVRALLVDGAVSPEVADLAVKLLGAGFTGDLATLLSTAEAVLI